MKKIILSSILVCFFFLIEIQGVYAKDFSLVQINNSNNNFNISNNIVALANTTTNPIKIGDSEELKCDKSLRDFIRKYWKYVFIIAPLLLMVMITVDFCKALFSNDQDAISKSASNAFKRVIAAVLLLALPIILDFVLGMVGLQLCL